MTYEESVSYILNIPKFTTKNELDHTRYFLQALGNPQENMKIIHVAGTNGKGSVCAYLQSILLKAGKKTAMFTSPHLVKINERFRMNGSPVSDEAFTEAFETVYQYVKKAEAQGIAHPTFFEYLFLMAMVLFQDCEYIILETGLGGRLDATNVIEHPMVSVITAISLDHTELLGDTVEKIALEKAGILKKDTPVVFDGNSAEASAVIQKRAEELGIEYSAVTKKDIKNLCSGQKSVDFSTYVKYYIANGVFSEAEEWFTIPFQAPYQAENAVLALRAAMHLDCKEAFTLDILKQGLSNMQWEGRMEEIMPGIIVDGAHNEAGMEAFIRAASLTDNEKILLFTAVKEKEYEHMIADLCRELTFAKIIVTELAMPRAAKVEELANIFQKYADCPVEVQKDIKQALTLAEQSRGAQTTLYCVGSLYLVGEVKAILSK